MKDRFMRFMAGRNGTDPLNRFLLLLAFVLVLLSSFIRGFAGRIFGILLLIVLIAAYYRMFSRNLSRRREENARYLDIRYKISAVIRVLGERWVQRKEYKFFYCPSCRTALRVPRGRGKIMIVCKKCGTKFTGKS